MSPVGESEETCAAWALYVGGIVFQVLGAPERSYLEAAGRLHVERIVSALGHVATAFLVGAVLVAGLGLAPMALMFAAGTALTTFLLVVVRRRVSGPRTSGPFLNVSFRDLAREAGGLLWVNVGAAASKAGYAPIVTGLLGAAQLAPLFFLIRLSNLAATAVGVVVLSDRARFMRSFATGDLAALRVLLRSLAPWYVILAAGSAVLLVAGAPAVTSVLVGEAFKLDPLIYALIGVDLLLNNIAAACAHLVLASGRNPFKASVGLSGVLTVAGLVLLVPQFGLVGAALAPLIAGCLTSYWFNIYSAYRLFKAGLGQDRALD